MSQAEVDAEERPGTTSEEHAEIKRFKAENQRLRKDMGDPARANNRMGGGTRPRHTGRKEAIALGSPLPPERLADSQELFREPSTGALGRLRSDQDVRWLMRVRLAGPRAGLTLRIPWPSGVFDSNDVVIFRVHEPRLDPATG